jgi:SNF2 family DNA or RNA helicase
MRPEAPSGPYAVVVKENFEDLEWDPKIPPRNALISGVPPDCLRTSLMPHQVDGFHWSVEAWKSGLPGILNADDQGLGKTLQTLAFMAWLVSHMKETETNERLPLLIVAPTSLLRNWEAEAEKHLRTDAIGSLFRAYGSAISGLRREGAAGKDTDDGEAKLKFDQLKMAIEDGRGHKRWVLTTYETLANYHISFRDIEFSLVVFDEIQKLKNLKTMLNRAGRSVKARFRIGLTGTPIENRLSDLWTIMDVIAPGKLGTLRNFSEFYEDPTENRMKNLYAHVFERQEKYPAVGLRRMKDDVIEGLPRKYFRIHVRDMPEPQALAYDAVRDKLINETSGVMLRTLHHIRSVSLHPESPALAAGNEAGYVAMSARLQSAIEILEEVKNANERVLIFIEDQKMQWFFAEYLREHFKLERVRIINGQTTIPRRMEYVKEFQKHLENDQGFDLMILGPRAAGVGLTLTAAVHVIHLSRWWNPAVEDQCNDRIYRIGQKKDVTIHILLAVHQLYKRQSFDCVLNDLMRRKRVLSRSALWPSTDSDGDMSALVGGMTLESNFELGVIDDFDPVQFEHWILNEANKLDDWTALSTPVTGDAGADGVLKHRYRPNHGAIFQAKHTANHINNVQVSAVEEVINASSRYGIDGPQLFVLTNASGFSGAAVELAAKNQVTLVARNHLSLWPNHLLA